MSAHVSDGGMPPPAWAWRWPAAFAAVLLLHAGAIVLLQQVHASQRLDSPAEAILLELAPAAPQTPPAPAETAPPPPAAIPAPVAPPEPTPPDPTPPDPVPPVQALPIPPPPAMPPPVKPEVVLPRPVPPHPVARPRPRPPTPKPAPTQLTAAPAPPAAPSVEPISPTAAPQAASQAAPSNPAAAATWASKLAAHLLRFRRYPPEAERRGMTGVVMMRFSVDASGHIVSAAMVHGSGHDILDEEADAWLRRAQPLPAPPPDRMAPAQIVVPLSFVLN